MPSQPTVVDLPSIATSHWLVLALVIEKLSYGYETKARYDRRFGWFLPMAATSMYGKLDRLEDVGLVEAVRPSMASRKRHVRVIYAPSSSAMRAHRRWLSSPIPEGRWHGELLARMGTAHLHGASIMLDLLDRYAQQAEQHKEQIEDLMAERSVGGYQSLRNLSAMLLLQEQYRVAEICIAWVAGARLEVRRAMDGR